MARDLLLSAFQRRASPERARLNLAEHLIRIGDFSASREILHHPSGDQIDAKNSTIAHDARDYLYEKLRLTAVAVIKDSKNPSAVDARHESTSMASQSVVFAPWVPKNWAGLAFTRAQSNQNVVA